MVEQKNGSAPAPSPDIIARQAFEKGLFREYPGIVNTIDYLMHSPDEHLKADLAPERINAWIFGKHSGHRTYSIDTVFYYLMKGHPGLSDAEINRPEFKTGLIEMADEEIGMTKLMLENEYQRGVSHWESEEEKLKAVDRVMYLNEFKQLLSGPHPGESGHS